MLFQSWPSSAGRRPTILACLSCRRWAASGRFWWLARGGLRSICDLGYRFWCLQRRMHWDLTLVNGMRCRIGLAPRASRLAPRASRLAPLHARGSQLARPGSAGRPDRRLSSEACCRPDRRSSAYLLFRADCVSCRTVGGIRLTVVRPSPPPAPRLSQRRRSALHRTGPALCAHRPCLNPQQERLP